MTDNVVVPVAHDSINNNAKGSSDVNVQFEMQCRPSKDAKIEPQNKMETGLMESLEIERASGWK